VSARLAVVAIDGPAGAGKSSASRGLAERLGYQYVDTGAMYRLVGLLAAERGTALDDDVALATLTRDLAPDLERADLHVGGRDHSAAIRSASAGELASRVSTRTVVREALVAIQRRLGAGGGVVMEGRDIGTVVLPNAPLKVFLTADPGQRAHRRAADLRALGQVVDEAALAEEIARRDRRDQERTDSPLRPATGARVLDTTAMTLVEVVDQLEGWARECGLPTKCP
jgi:cytidylate kinase